MALNINPSVDDCFYRYKMPRLIAKVEGKGNGIKTVIANMPEIAKALNRPPTYPTKYFGCELGAQTQVDTKNERYIVNGEHDQAKLQEALYGFIKKFVLCQSCENPETTLKVRRGGQNITQSCKACGHVGNIDMKHKLTSFIVKSPPPVEDTADSAAGRKGDSDDVHDSVDGVDAAIIQNGTHNGNSDSPVNNNRGADDDDDDEWEPEVLTNKDELTGRMKLLIVNSDLDKPIDERLDMFYAWLQEYMKNDKLDNSAVVNEALRLDVRDKASLLLPGSLYKPATLLDDIKKHRLTVLRFTNENPKAQKYFLGGIEQLIINNRALLLPKTPQILKQLYDDDILSEETLLEWGKKASKKYVARADSQAIIDTAAPLLKWLAEAEVEDSDEDDDDDEVAFESDKPAAAPTKTSVKVAAATTNGKGAAKSSEDDDDDLNIDDI